jgi:ribosomal protein S18 acetylase RimI-like enzyme
MIRDTTIRLIEECSLNALPSLQTIVYDGWLLRFAEGYTRRANSVNPLYPSTLELVDKVAYCEALYSAHKLPVVFKLTSAAEPPDLDLVLARGGYAREATTSVQTLDLAEYQMPFLETGVELETEVSERWLEDFCRLSQIDTARLPLIRQILGALTPQVCFASLSEGDHVVSVGLGVLERGYLGLFDIATQEAQRRQGCATRVIRAVMGWGGALGAHTAYLQVMRENEPALALYAKLGFAEIYTYWYRTRRVASC